MLGHVLVAWGNLSERRIPKEHRVFERDGWRCAVPGCTSYRNRWRDSTFRVGIRGRR